MLLGQQLGRRHDGGLEAPGSRDHGSHRGDHRLPRADVTLQQPVHRHVRREIGDDLSERALLRSRQRERQGSSKFRELRLGSGQRIRAFGARDGRGLTQ